MAMAGLMKGGGRHDELQLDSLYLDYVMLCVLIDCVWPDADSVYVISMSWRRVANSAVCTAYTDDELIECN